MFTGVDTRRIAAVAVAAALVVGTGSVAAASVVYVSITPTPVTARIVTETRPYTIASSSTAVVSPFATTTAHH
jgi:hypothetical protein